MKKKTLLNVLKNLLFFALGIGMFLWVYRDKDINDLFSKLKNFSILYIGLSVLFSIFSNYSRAMRWNLLLQPMGHKVNTFKAFLSIQVMYLANMVVPRAGEIVRCTLLSKYENVPFTKLVGTVIIERVADAIALFTIAFVTILTQLGTIKRFFAENPANTEKIEKLFSATNIILVLSSITLIALLLFVFRKKMMQTKLFEKIKEFLLNMLEGVKTILKLEKPLQFILHTIFIYVMWLLMLYVFFIGFVPTRELSLFAAVTVFVMGGLAMIAPVQAGVGAYHFMVSNTLVLYGVLLADGEDFAFIIHSSTNLYLAVFGLISLAVFLIIGRKNKVSKNNA